MLIHKLGRVKRAHDPAKLLWISDYLDRKVSLPPPPDRVDWVTAVPDMPMLLNDKIGDCTVAGMAHLHQIWGCNAGNPLTPSDDEVLAVYRAISGYTGDPKSEEDDPTDTGCAEEDVFRYCKENAVFGGAKLAGWVAVNPKNPLEVMQAMDLFGGVYWGVSLPNAWKGADVWNVPAGTILTGDWAPGSWGEHCVISGRGLKLVGAPMATWGMEGVSCSWEAIATFFDMGWALLSEDWIDKATAKAPSGFDFATLKLDLAAL